jgi:NADH-quinone oxidoreductase subunit M
VTPATLGLWALPAAAGVLTLAFPKRGGVPLVAATLTFLLGVFTVGLDVTQGADVPGVGADVDPGNWMFLLLTALLGVLVQAYGLRLQHVGGAWAAHGLLLQALVTAELMATDFLVFGACLWLEAFVVRAFVARYGTGQDRHAVATDVFRRFVFGAATWSLGAVIFGLRHLEATGRFSTALVDLRTLPTPTALAPALLVLLGSPLAARMGAFPWHGWVRPVASEGPVLGVLVPLLAVKVGVVTWLRLLVPLLSGVMVTYAPWLQGLGLVGFAFGVLVALTEHDLRRMLAGLAVAHAGFLLVPLASAEPHGVSGAVLEAVDLGVAEAGLWFAAGFLWLRTRATAFHDLADTTSSMPKFGLVFLLVALAAIGMPGTLGFEAIHLEIEGSLATGHWVSAFAEAAAPVLFAAVLLGWFQRLFLSEPSAEVPRAQDLRVSELLVAAALAAVLVDGGLDATRWVEAVEHEVAWLLQDSAFLAHEAQEHAPPVGADGGGAP